MAIISGKEVVKISGTRSDFFAEVGDEAHELLYYTLAATSIEPLLNTRKIPEGDVLRAAEARYWCGHTQREFGDWSQARENYDKAIGTLDNLLKTSPDHRKAQGLLGKAHHFQAQVHDAMGNASMAAKHHRLAVTLLEPMEIVEPDVVVECLQTSREWLLDSP